MMKEPLSNEELERIVNDDYFSETYAEIAVRELQHVRRVLIDWSDSVHDGSYEHRHDSKCEAIRSYVEMIKAS